MEVDLKQAAFAALNQHLQQHAGDLLENCRQIQQTLTKMDWASIATDNDKMVKRVLRFVWGVFNAMRDQDRAFCEKSVEEVANVFADGLEQAHDNFQRHVVYLKEQRDSDLEEQRVAAQLAVQAEQLKWTAERDLWIQRAVHTVEVKYEEKIKVLVVESSKNYDELFLQLNSSDAALKKAVREVGQANRERAVAEQSVKELEKEVLRLQSALVAATAAAAAAKHPAPDRHPLPAALSTPKAAAPVVVAAAAPKPVPKADSSLQTSLFNEQEFRRSVAAEQEAKLVRLKNDLIARHELALRAAVQEKDGVISQLSEQLAAAGAALKVLQDKVNECMARIAELLKSNSEMRGQLLQAQQQQRPATVPKPPRDLTLSLFTQFQPAVATCDASVQCEAKAEAKPMPVAEKRQGLAVAGAACQTDPLIVPVSPRGYKSLGMDKVVQWAATQTHDAEEGQQGRVVAAQQATIRKLEGDVASQQMLCESLARSFADQLACVRRYVSPLPLTPNINTAFLLQMTPALPAATVTCTATAAAALAAAPTSASCASGRP